MSPTHSPDPISNTDFPTHRFSSLPHSQVLPSQKSLSISLAPAIPKLDLSGCLDQYLKLLPVGEKHPLRWWQNFWSKPLSTDQYKVQLTRFVRHESILGRRIAVLAAKDELRMPKAPVQTQAQASGQASAAKPPSSAPSSFTKVSDPPKTPARHSESLSPLPVERKRKHRDVESSEDDADDSSSSSQSPSAPRPPQPPRKRIRVSETGSPIVIEQQSTVLSERISRLRDIPATERHRRLIASLRGRRRAGAVGLGSNRTAYWDTNLVALNSVKDVAQASFFAPNAYNLGSTAALNTIDSVVQISNFAAVYPLQRRLTFLLSQLLGVVDNVLKLEGSLPQSRVARAQGGESDQQKQQHDQHRSPDANKTEQERDGSAKGNNDGIFSQEIGKEEQATSLQNTMAQFQSNANKLCIEINYISAWLYGCFEVANPRMTIWLITKGARADPSADNDDKDGGRRGRRKTNWYVVENELYWECAEKGPMVVWCERIEEILKVGMERRG